MPEEITALDVIEGPITPVQSTQPITLFGTADPVEVLDRAAKVATALADVLRKRHLYATIRDRNYVTVEGWTLLGSMLGVFPQIEWTRKLEDGWEARAVATVAATGRVVGAGEAQCTRTEGTWRGRDDYALRAMAQTRAISRALRGPLDFVVKLAGYESTPSDELPDQSPEKNALSRETDTQGARAETALPAVTPITPSLAPAPSDGQGDGGSARQGNTTTGPPFKTPTEILEGARSKTPQAKYGLEDAVCPECGRKEYLGPSGTFCAIGKGGCGWPKSKGVKGTPISYGQYLERQKQ